LRPAGFLVTAVPTSG